MKKLFAGILILSLLLSMSMLPASAAEKAYNLIYTLNFNGDAQFAPETLQPEGTNTIKVTVKSANEANFVGPAEAKANVVWGAPIKGLNVTANDRVVMVCEMKSEADDGSNYLGIGAWCNDFNYREDSKNNPGTPVRAQLIYSYYRHTAAAAEDNLLVWPSLGATRKESKSATAVVAADGFVRAATVLDGVAKQISHYVQTASGWTAVADPHVYDPTLGELGFYTFMYNPVANVTVRNVNFYKEVDAPVTTKAPDTTKAPETTAPAQTPATADMGISLLACVTVMGMMLAVLSSKKAKKQ